MNLMTTCIKKFQIFKKNIDSWASNQTYYIKISILTCLHENNFTFLMLKWNNCRKFLLIIVPSISKHSVNTVLVIGVIEIPVYTKAWETLIEMDRSWLSQSKQSSWAGPVTVSLQEVEGPMAKIVAMIGFTWMKFSIYWVASLYTVLP